jgi:hypothetical protein
MFVERKDVIGFRLAPLHTGRADGHARHGQAQHRRLLLQEAMNQIRRNMTFDDVIIHQRGMARTEFHRDVISDFDLVQLASTDILFFDFEPVRLQVPDPGSAAASAWVLIHGYGARERRRLSLRACDQRENA